MVFRLAALLALISTTAWPVAAFADDGRGNSRGSLGSIKHIVVIYEENHSFDNLYGSWPGVNGVASATAANTLQLSASGTPFTCLLQNDLNLAALPATCMDTPNSVNSAFTNAPFTIDKYIGATAKTCPAPGVFAANGVQAPNGLPGGCTRDIVHRYYQEPFQLNGGAQNRYVLGSDAGGLTMGVYDTQSLPIYAYLNQAGHPDYAIADNFFQAAFGGSFLNHQWLVAAATPKWTGSTAPAALHSIVDANGFPNSSYPLYHPATTVRDGPLTVACSSPHPANLLCGDYAVNTIQPTYQPHALSGVQLPPLTTPTIGDRLSAEDVSWAWYSGGWSNANGNVGAPGWTPVTVPNTCNANSITGAVYPNCPDKLFQFHHQPLNYYASFAPGTEARAQHLRDEAEFIARAQASTKKCDLKSVSFVKPIGADNEHPGYTNETSGSQHLVKLLKAIEGSACAKDTMVVVTYDEFGGQWDHVAPPGQGNNNGPHDKSGPGTRIPTLVIAPNLRDDFVVDSTSYDTTSILATIEHRFDLRPLSSRDRRVNDLSHVFRAKAPNQQEGDTET